MQKKGAFFDDLGLRSPAIQKTFSPKKGVPIYRSTRPFEKKDKRSNDLGIKLSVWVSSAHYTDFFPPIYVQHNNQSTVSVCRCLMARGELCVVTNYDKQIFARRNTGR